MLPFLPALGTALATGIGSSMAGSIMGDGDKETEGIQSQVQGSNPPAEGEIPPPASTSGSQAEKLLKSGVDAAFEKGISSVLNPQMSGAEKGKHQRDFNEAAYPELNQWEQAGASASQAGVQAGEQQNAEKLQSKQLRSQEKVATQTNQTAENVANIAANTARHKAPSEIAQTKAQTSKVPHEVKQIQAQTKQLLESQGIIGKNIADGEAALIRYSDGEISLPVIKEKLKELGSSESGAETVLKAISPLYRKYGKDIKSAYGDFVDNASSWLQGHKDSWNKTKSKMK